MKSITEMLINYLCGIKRKAHGAQDTSTAQRKGTARCALTSAQRINPLFLCGILAGILFCTCLYAQEIRQPETPPSPVAKKTQEPRQPKQPPSGAKKVWAKQTDWLAGTEKRLKTLKETTLSASDDADVKNLLERAADLIEQAESSKDNQFQAGRRLHAANAMMDAADRVLLALKIGAESDEGDFRRAGFVLQGCYFRIRQAAYFAGVSGDEKSRHDVRLATRLYQQGRSAFDAKEYGRARLLGDASTSVVFALERMAQATTAEPRIDSK